jgi:hypothetical protein
MAEGGGFLKAGDIANVKSLNWCSGKRFKHWHRFGPSGAKHHEHLMVAAKCATDCRGGLVGQSKCFTDAKFHG